MFQSIYLTILLFTLLPLTLSAQIPVSFFSETPVIDGLPNINIKVSEFAVITKSVESNPDIRAGYYLAYDEKALYIYIEAEADSLTIRDRGYQNGDGFHLVIGKAQENEVPTREFYVLGFSPEITWRRKMIWYYNVDLKMAELGKDVKFETGVKNGKISFEALIPWKAVYPYHPWLCDRVGFNLCFVKAVKDKEKNYYFIKTDRRMQSEQSAREYAVLQFEKPVKAESRFASALIRNHLTEKEMPSVRIAGHSAEEIKKNFSVSVMSEDHSVVMRKEVPLVFSAGVTENQIPINCPKPGNYTVKVFCDAELIGEHVLSVFPEIDTESMRSTIGSYRPEIPAGTYYTLIFYVNDLDSSLRKLKSYEASPEILKKVEETGQHMDQLKTGKDPVASKRGVYRRAYGANPYSVYVPAEYDPAKKYPLLVYLHGSGDDDRVLQKTAVPDGFIVLAPNGRGTSNCFAGAEPQADIAESIADVIRHFNIDTTKIILSGFSMGGYGVYRTYYEQPQRFKAVAVISGHPDLARKWVDENELNFLDERNLSQFKHVPVYIFHGRKDMNCPFELTEQLAAKLKAIGCDLVFEIDDAGHGNMKPEIRERYFEWLREHVK